MVSQIAALIPGYPMSEPRSWLEAQGLGKYAEVLAENDVDLDVLPELTDADLRVLGVSLGYRKRLLKAAGELSNRRAALPSESPAATRAAERRQLTVMFCDLVGSTALSANMDPEAYREVLVSYQDAARDAIGRYEGYIARYMGDGLLVYFGYPQAHEDDAERAVRAGLDIVDRIGAISVDDDIALQVRIGIATGLVVAGDIVGEGASEERAVLGDTPNLAARLQGIAAPNTVVIADGTKRLTAGRFELEALGPQSLKGMKTLIPAHRAVSVRTESRFEAAASRGLTAMIGRQSELSLLRQRWAQVEFGEGQVVVLSGEPGIGKSRLAEEIREHADSEGFPVFRYQCSPYHSGSAFYPFIDHLQRAAKFTESDSGASRLEKLGSLLGQLLPDVELATKLLAALMSLPMDHYPPLEMSPERQKAETIGVLVRLIAHQSVRTSTLVLFEDVHWIDPSSRETLDALVEESRSRRVLCLITHRPEFAPPWSGAGHVTTLSLNRLGRREVSEIIGSVTGGMSIPQDVQEQILERTDGVPLFVEELTKSVIEAGVLEEIGGRYVTAGRLPSLAIPATLHDSLLARLDRLGDVKELAQTAACIGREFALDLLAGVSGLEATDLDGALERLINAGLIFRRRGGDGGAYVFKHALVQDTAYETLLMSRRREVHARIAHVLEEQFSRSVSTEPERLAQHYSAADLPVKAIPHWLAAGRRSLSSSSLPEAISHFSTALELTADIDDEFARAERELEVRTGLGTATIALHGWPSLEVRAVVQPACNLFESGHGDADAFINLWNLWLNNGCRGEHREGLEVIERMLSYSRDKQDRTLTLIASFAASMANLWVGNYDLSLKYETTVLDIYDFERDKDLAWRYNHDPKNTLLSWASNRVWALGYPDKARVMSETAVAHARRVGHPFNLCWTLGNSSLTRSNCGDFHQARAWLEELSQIAHEQDLTFMNAYMTSSCRSSLAAHEGRYEVAIEEGTRAEQVWSSIGGRLWSPTKKAYTAFAYLRLGHAEKAAKLIDAAIELIDETGEMMLAEELYRIAGMVRLERDGDADAAQAQFRRSLEYSKQHGTRSYELRTAICLAKLWSEQGKRQKARDLLAPICERFNEGLDTADLVEGMALLDALR
jgi:class 3 adenylate cyclase/tetratricopeptide (TPR) repeat protein